MAPLPRTHDPRRRRFLAGSAALAAGGLFTRAAAAERTPPNLPQIRQTNDDIDWAAVRSQFILPPDMVYMNSGSEGSMPGFVLNNLAQYSTQWAKNPSYSYFSDPELGQYQTVNRERVARFLGTQADNICLTNNTTMGLAMATLGINLESGDEILTTNQEHYSLLSPLDVLARRWGVQIRELAIPIPPSSPEQIIEIFESAITAKTKAVCFSHVTWTNGLRMPVAAICAIMRDRGEITTIIDGAQAPGAVALNLPELACDYYAGPGHKWLSGPPGTGFLFARNAASVPVDLWPILSEDALVMDQYPITTVLQIRGCNNTPSFEAMCDVMDFEGAIGQDAIAQRLATLNRRVKTMAVSRWGEACLFTSLDPALSAGIAAFVPSADPAKRHDQSFVSGVVTALQDRGIWARMTQFPDPAAPAEATTYTLRVSTNIFNDSQDIDVLFAALDTITSG
ncbi:aminotransferase class V-fold PLP-dependent enzyme [Roseospira marina]|nr:aminotransferase class V-fold PLP-dependent enzyme [Roseospira marina]MBB4313513.1 selenocysteine lyase/cysteine desulfurase [Roseospira marina]MBB5086675.1 selenocysteine lyase/cysteine desulfurase [Roseospira marina]